MDLVMASGIFGLQLPPVSERAIATNILVKQFPYGH